LTTMSGPAIRCGSLTPFRQKLVALDQRRSQGPGAAAGVRQGDIIVAWNGEPIRGVHHLVRALGPDSVGASVRLTLRRAGEPVEAMLTIGERPESP
jgi:S1-C subfamily serine protease